MRFTLRIVNRGDVNAVIEEFGTPHAQQNFVEDRTVDYQIFLPDVSAGFSNA
jgi:hypothetical protein